ncbi:hypothetical protein RND71_017617 [Anisodus tanguticus]|uniref:NAC domain-containing protein n=1 Tax=Anisodus tanguticus TaxID=243964 RepID=A0AAE1S4H2_9SOLA|nr:hypothetical protein RND71_017617 [Anisodus tanguticus]
MSTVPAARRSVMGVRFHPTDAEIINYLKRYFKGEPFSSQCPIQFADIYGDQPPWEIFGASEEKVRYFITPLKKRKSEHIRFVRTCANGTWKGQTSEDPIKNRKGGVVGFRRSLTFQTKEREQNKTWLMKEYSVANDFFRKNNIPKEDFVVCRIKKRIKEKRVKDYAVTYMEENDDAGIFEAMLHGPDDFCTTQPAENQAMEETDQWESIIDGVCDEQVDVVENTTTLHGEYDLRGCNQQNDQILWNTYEATTENQNTTTTLLEQEAYSCDQPLSGIEQVQGDGSDYQTVMERQDFWELMNEILGDVTIDVSDDMWHIDDHSSLLLDTNENI